MNKTVPITNDGENDLHVGGRVIPPGETKLFDEADLPPHMRQPHDKPAPLPSEPDDPLLELLDQPVKAIQEAVAERDEAGLPVLSDDDIERLAVAEANGKTRSTLMKALNEERVQRANAAQQREDHAVFVESLKETDAEQLEALKKKHQEDPDKVAAIEHQQLVNEIAGYVEAKDRGSLEALRELHADDEDVAALIDAALDEVPAE